MLIKNGSVYQSGGFKPLDILIENGKIKKVGRNLAEPRGKAGEVIDANGLYVLPGAVDVHTHMDLDVGFARANDDFYTGTMAAACGGTTTIVDHIAFGPEKCALNHQIDQYHKLAEGKAVIDYGFHGVIQHVDDDVLAKMESLIEAGITSYKIYMTYAGMLSDDAIFQVLKRAKELKLLIAVHTENNDIVERLKEDFVSAGKTTPEYHPKSRPAMAEAEAVNRVLTIGRAVGDAPLYLVHVSNGLSMEYIDFFKRRGYQNFFIETCPQYLYLDDRKYKAKDGLKYIFSPPLRAKENIQIMWQALNLGEIDTIATDHCPFAFKTDKQMGKDDFTKCPNGIPGVEVRYPLMLSAAMNKQISFERVVETCAENPAKLFGIYPQKGVIAAGSDADLVIFDPEAKGRIAHDDLHENVDYTPYEGIPVSGRITTVVAVGEKIVTNNTFIGERGRGRFLKRKRYQKL